MIHLSDPKCVGAVAIWIKKTTTSRSQEKQRHILHRPREQMTYKNNNLTWLVLSQISDRMALAIPTTPATQKIERFCTEQKCTTAIKLLRTMAAIDNILFHSFVPWIFRGSFRSKWLPTTEVVSRILLRRYLLFFHQSAGDDMRPIKSSTRPTICHTGQDLTVTIHLPSLNNKWMPSSQ